MANSFSQQLKAKSTQQQQGRLTRTQRQVVEQEKQKQQRFEQLRSQAQAISENVFVEKEVTEKYYEYVPKSYLDRKGNITRDWQRMSEKNKRNIIKNTSARDLVSFERTRTYKDPFTFDEYKTEYSKLNPELQQFFTSPQEITSTEKAKITAKIDVWKAQIEERKQKIAEYEASWSSKSKNYREKHRESYREKIRKYNDDIEEYQDRISELESKSGEIEKGYKAEDLIEYAYSKADYRRSRQEARKSAEKQFQKDLASGKLDQTIEQLNKFRGIGKSGLTYKEYSTAVERYNKEVEYKQGLQKFAERVGGFEKLPEWAKQRLSPEAMKFQAENPSEKLFFDTSGNVKGVESGALQMSVAGTEAYSEKIKEQQEKDERLRAEAKIQLASLSGMQISEKPQDKTWWQKLVKGIKAGSLSSQFGTKIALPETTQSSLTAEREQRTRDAVTINDAGDLVRLSQGIPIFQIGTVPYESSLQAIERKEASDYRAKQKAVAIEELDKLVANAPDELKPYVQEEGIKILQDKGIRFKETTTPKLDIDLTKISGENKFNLAGFKQERSETTLTLVDPDFQRRISQEILEWERERKKEGWLGEALLTIRNYSARLLETYAISKGIEIGIKGITTGVGSLYTNLGGGLKLEGQGLVSGSAELPKLKFYKMIELQEGWARVPRDFKGVKTGFQLGVTGLYGFAKYQQYKTYKQTSEFGGEVFLIETLGEISGFELATGTIKKSYDKFKNKLDNLDLETVKQADISQKGFLRENKLTGKVERVYMERYKGFRLSKPRTWIQSLQGYQKGQFTGRTYKYLPDELVAYYQYGGDVNIYSSRKGGEIIKTVKAEPFPYEDPSTHLRWFKERNIAEYPVPRKSELPVNIKGKAFGYSATPSEWTGKEFSPNKIYYEDDGLKVLNTKGAVQYYSGKGASGGFWRVFKRGAYTEEVGKIATDPILYAGYFDDVAINPAIKEIKGVDTAGRELKAYLYSKDTGIAGTLNLPVYKREVEGTVEISSRIPIRKEFAINVAGWKIPIEEQVFGRVADLSQVQMDKIVKNIGSLKEITTPQYSYIPPRQDISYAIYSLIGSSKPKISYSTSKFSSVSYSKISSLKSLLSSKSSISKISSSSISRSSSSTSYLKSSISSYLSSINSSITSSIPSTNIYRIPKLERISTVKQKIKSKKRITPEIYGLLPDFTSRAIGLSPQEFNIKDVNKAVRKLQTGFEIRTGGRIKGITEKNLMKEVMLKL